MNTKLLACLAGVAVLAAGCIKTVNGDRTAGVPFIKDKIEAQYPRTVDQVYAASLAVIQANGTVIKENILHGQSPPTNSVAKTIEAKVQESTVWIRVQAVDPKVTSVTVQTRTKGGVSDIDLAATIDKQIALKLVR